MQFINLKTQYQRIQKDVDARIKRVFEHGQYIMGPEIDELEETLAAYVGAKHCIAMASGTDALLIAMMACGVGYGDEVITTPFSFIATAETIVLLGAKPVFVDVDPHTYNIDPALIEQAISSKTKAIMPVSLYGQCADFDRINQIAQHYGIPVIEDAAQSFGASYKDRYSCALSTIGCTSFFPTKPLGCYGDGGACFTSDDELAKLMREIRVHGQDRRYHHPRIGINGRLDTLQAAILLAKFEIFQTEVSERIRLADIYAKALHDVVTVPYIEPHNKSVYAQYTIQVERREALQDALKEQGIPTMIHYPVTLNMQPALAHLNQGKGTFPVAEKLAECVLSLPFDPYLSETAQQRVCKALLECINVIQHKDH